MSMKSFVLLLAFADVGRAGTSHTSSWAQDSNRSERDTPVARKLQDLTSVPLPTDMPAPTSMPTPMGMPSLMPTNMPMPIPMPTIMLMPTLMPTGMPMPTSMPTPVPAFTSAPVPTLMPSDTPMPTAPTPVPPPMPMPVPTDMPMLIPMPTGMPVPTDMLAPTSMPTPMGMPTLMPTDMPMPIPMPTVTLMPTLMPTGMPMPTSMPTPVPAFTSAPVPTLMPSDTPMPAVMPMPMFMPTGMPSPTGMPMPIPTSMPTFIGMPMPMGFNMPMDMPVMPPGMPMPDMPMPMPWPDMWSPHGNMTGNSSCLDTDGFMQDVSGNGCEWYEAAANVCGELDDSDFTAGDMCCACIAYRGQCSSGCPSGWVGDKICDDSCNVEECGFDGGDCALDAASTGCTFDCLPNWIGDKFCDDACNIVECNFDGGDCASAAALSGCPSDCPSYWIGDKFCDDLCNIAECNFDGGDCDGAVNCETYCHVNQYDANGQYTSLNTSCGTGSECPCNSEWEVQCDSYGYKYCVPTSEGCPVPYVVQCNNATEWTCKSDFGDYCWEKSWGNCPVECGWEEQICYSYAYDSSGNVDWSLPYTESCAPADDSCPCDTQWEQACTDAWGYTSCQPTAFGGCPVYCSDQEQYCYSTPYGSDGHPDWSQPSNVSCQSWDQHCPCHPVYETLCEDEWGHSWCNVNAHGSCPVTCAAHEHTCWITPYDQYGEVDWSGSWSEVCANATEGCPCDTTWEKQCRDSYGTYCMSISQNCPITCPAEHCYHYMSGNESCAGETGCTCESNELTCAHSDTGKNECYPTEWYSTCPVFCNWETEMSCWVIGFNSAEELVWTDYCHKQTSDWACPVLCDNTTAKKCGTGLNAYCVSSSEDCPQECTEKLCWVDDYDMQGLWIGGKDVCVSWDEDCPCGANQTRCTTWDGWSYCESSYFDCPVSCNPATQKFCYSESFTKDGQYDWDAPVNSSCVASEATCPCGANAKMCKWYDEYWGEDIEECYAASWACPVSCAANHSVCYQTEYNASGYPLTYLEKCVAKGQTCPCGSNSQTCFDPSWGESFCYPLWDFWADRKLECPVFCSASQDYCYVPSFDANGDQIDTAEFCVPSGGRCDCSRGQNAFECNFTDPTDPSFVFSTCLAVGSYCPASCAANQTVCSQVEDFLPNGTSLGFVSPRKACGKDAADCGCGKEAVMCGELGCFSKDEGCPITCQANERKCFLEDFSKNGSRISDREVCIASNQTCPCGKNTVKCPGQNVCVTQQELTTVCPCKAVEEECLVQDYDGAGKRKGFPRSVCAPKGECPCGDGTTKCSDGKCIPKYIGTLLNRCPEPCPDGDTSGNETCIQTNLDKTGIFVSKTTTCVAPGTCKPGKNQIKCPSGAVVPASAGCVDLYGGSNKTRDKTKKQTAEIIITLSDVKSDASGQVDSVAASVSGVVQAPGVDSSISVKQGNTASTRRLQGQSSSSTKVVIKIEEVGSTAVAPQDVAEVAKSKVRSQSPDMLKALSSLGSVDPAAGVSIATTETLVVDRATAAAQQKQQGLIAAGIIRTTTTTSKQATCSTFSCPNGTVLNSTRADSPKVSSRECCVATCALYTCPINYTQNASNADSTTLAAAECCVAPPRPSRSPPPSPPASPSPHPIPSPPSLSPSPSPPPSPTPPLPASPPPSPPPSPSPHPIPSPPSLSPSPSPPPSPTPPLPASPPPSPPPSPSPHPIPSPPSLSPSPSPPPSPSLPTPPSPSPPPSSSPSPSNPAPPTPSPSPSPPPSPSPTPPATTGPVDLSSRTITSFASTLEMADVTRFDRSGYIKVMAAASNLSLEDVEVESVEYIVEVGYSLSTQITQQQATALVAASIGVDALNISVTVTATRRLARRLSAYRVDAQIKTQEVAQVDSIAAVAANTTVIAGALSTMNIEATIEVAVQPKKKVKVNTKLKSAPGAAAVSAPSATQLASKLSQELAIDVKTEVSEEAVVQEPLLASSTTKTMEPMTTSSTTLSFPLKFDGSSDNSHTLSLSLPAILALLALSGDKRCA
eukprot:TRINITY_DN1420_c0_g2_i1.p1 TRINITY_DN1420_c0_g2~~TRINITY_DN1420_c0_g2_i1.p1  ORF type:complete len:2017 (+),score=244.24 TRINITY_DN1420_c0_g2_i1:59-6109(+)